MAQHWLNSARLRTLLLGALLLLLYLASAGDSQTLLPPPVAQPSQELLPPSAGQVFAIPVSEGANPDKRPALPIDFRTALRLTITSNLDIAQAREFVNQARARQQAAEVMALPNLNLGSAYNHHEGNIAKTEGNIIKANRDSLFAGGGPSMTFQVADAIFLPLVARQLAAASQAGRQRITNDTLLLVADAYFNVLRARRRIARVGETLEFLTSERPAPIRGQSKGMLPLVRDVVELGGKEALRSDLARVEVEVLRRRDEWVAAVQDWYLATAELARLLRLDPETPLAPTEDFRQPLPLPGEEWSDRPLDELVTLALMNRPELAENRALVEAALDRVRAAKVRPFLPNLTLNYAWGDYGGGPDLNPPIVLPPATKGGPPRVVSQPGFGPSDHIHHFSPRTDLDVSLFWRLQNLGFGNVAEKREQEALHRQAILRQLQVHDRIVTQVVQTQEQVQSWRERLTIIRTALFDADGAPAGPVFRSLRLSFERIQGGEGRPLEALDSIRSLSDTLEAYGQAITDYERSRFQFLIALGMPSTGFLDPSQMPVPCPPPSNGDGKP
ncbi:MAG TPA: TolC family protein [Gemmataceae bacterium]|nr:TolC family protein [Gemmataceae bacterium]